VLGNRSDAWNGLNVTLDKGELGNLSDRTALVDRLQTVCSELAEIHRELAESNIEPDALRVLRDTLDQMRETAVTLRQGMERSQLSADKQHLWRSLIGERMRLASHLNTDIWKNLEAGRIRTDQGGLSVYMRVLNQVMEQVDLLFESRKA
jgi:hypothetical protein